MRRIDKQKSLMILRGFLSISVIVTLVFSQIILPAEGWAHGLPDFPVPGAMVNPSHAFVPVLLKGMTIYPEDPLRFEFIIDGGKTNLPQEKLKKEAERLVKYFLASLTVPEDDLWVNLSPYEDDRIIPEELGRTELGRDMLAQDYLLKQLTATFMNPENAIGAKFWNKIYKSAQEKLGTSEIPMNTFNKVWIMPESATVYEKNQTVYVVDSRLKVLLDEDYLALNKHREKRHADIDRRPDRQYQETASLSLKIVREVILPEIEREVNEGKNFALLRQIYHSLILSKWYKETVKTSLLSKVYVGQKKMAGIECDDKTLKNQIYARYRQAYKKGVFNFIKEEYDESSNEVLLRKYFSGGQELDEIPLHRTRKVADFDSATAQNPNLLTVAMAPQGKATGGNQFSDQDQVDAALTIRRDQYEMMLVTQFLGTRIEELQALSDEDYRYAVRRANARFNHEYLHRADYPQLRPVMKQFYLKGIETTQSQIGGPGTGELGRSYFEVFVLSKENRQILQDNGYILSEDVFPEGPYDPLPIVDVRYIVGRKYYHIGFTRSPDDPLGSVIEKWGRLVERLQPQWRSLVPGEELAAPSEPFDRSNEPLDFRQELFGVEASGLFFKELYADRRIHESDRWGVALGKALSRLVQGGVHPYDLYSNIFVRLDDEIIISRGKGPARSIIVFAASRTEEPDVDAIVEQIVSGRPIRAGLPDASSPLDSIIETLVHKDLAEEELVDADIDVLMIPGNDDISIYKKALDFKAMGIGQYILISGGTGRLTEDIKRVAEDHDIRIQKSSEAEMIRDIMVGLAQHNPAWTDLVDQLKSDEFIILEKKARYTVENFSNAKLELRARGLLGEGRKLNILYMQKSLQQLRTKGQFNMVFWDEIQREEIKGISFTVDYKKGKHSEDEATAEMFRIIINAQKIDPQTGRRNWHVSNGLDVIPKEDWVAGKNIFGQLSPERKSMIADMMTTNMKNMGVDRTELMRDLPDHVRLFAESILASSTLKTVDDVGGIDLNEIPVERKGSRVNITFDPAVMQDILEQGVDGFAPVIIDLAPVSSIIPLLGLERKRRRATSDPFNQSRKRIPGRGSSFASFLANPPPPY